MTAPNCGVEFEYKLETSLDLYYWNHSLRIQGCRHSNSLHNDRHLGPRPQRDPLDKVQGLENVHSHLSSAPNQNGRLPDRHDLLRLLRVCRDGCIIRYHSPPCELPGTHTHTHTHTFAHPSYLSIIDYLDQQSQLQGQHPGVFIHNNDFIGAASYNIFAGISVAFIFGGAFFFDLFWPERHEDRGIRWAWKGCAVLESLIMLSSALAMTVCSPYKWASFLICVAHAVSI